LHELTHSQQELSVSAEEEIYGPDGDHFSTEVTSLKNAALEGYAEFWDAWFAPHLWGKLEFGLALCGLRFEDSFSTPENPSYNGVTLDQLQCDDYTPYQDLDKDDYFRAEGVFASILLELGLRVDNGLDLIIQAFENTNGVNQDSQSIITELGSLMTDEERGAFTIILDVLTAFQYSMSELQGFTQVSQGLVDQYESLVRPSLQAKALETTDDNGFTVRYNGFHALDDAAGQTVLPRTNSRAADKGTPKAATPINNEFIRSPSAEGSPVFAAPREEFQDLYQPGWDDKPQAGHILRQGY